MRRILALLAFVLLCAVPTAGQSPAITQPLTSSSCPGSGCLTLSVQGLGSAGIQVTGTFVGTLQFEGTLTGTTYVAFQVGTVADPTSTATSATAPGAWQGLVGGLAIVRVRFSAYTSGTATVTIQGAQGGGAGAPVGATYVTLSTNPVLTNERVLTAGSNVTLTDGGAGSTITIAATGGGGGSPGGSDTQVQFNDANAFGGDAGFVYDKATDTVTVAGTGQFAGVGIGTAGVGDALTGAGTTTLSGFSSGTFGTLSIDTYAFFDNGATAIGFNGTPLSVAGGLFAVGADGAILGPSGFLVSADGSLNVANVFLVDGGSGNVTGAGTATLGNFATGSFGTSVVTPLLTRDSGDLTINTTTSGKLILDPASHEIHINSATTVNIIGDNGSPAIAFNDTGALDLFGFNSSGYGVTVRSINQGGVLVRGAGVDLVSDSGDITVTPGSGIVAVTGDVSASGYTAPVANATITLGNGSSSLPTITSHDGDSLKLNSQGQLYITASSSIAFGVDSTGAFPTLFIDTSGNLNSDHNFNIYTDAGKTLSLTPGSGPLTVAGVVAASGYTASGDLGFTGTISAGDLVGHSIVVTGGLVIGLTP